mgnify:FL=1
MIIKYFTKNMFTKGFKSDRDRITIPRDKIQGITSHKINCLLKGTNQVFIPNCAVVMNEDTGKCELVATNGFRHLDDLEERLNKAISKNKC